MSMFTSEFLKPNLLQDDPYNLREQSEKKIKSVINKVKFLKSHNKTLLFQEWNHQLKLHMKERQYSSLA